MAPVTAPTPGPLPARRALLVVALAAALPGPGWAQAPDQTGTTPASNPPAPAAAAPQAATVVDEAWADATRDRVLPLRIRWPAAGAPLPAGGRPVVLFSHGLGGTRAGGQVWGQAWAAAGLVVLHLQHPGSDLAAVRRVASSFDDLAGLRRAAGPEQLMARLHDVAFVLDELQRRQAAGDGPWAGVRPHGVGLSGHSFGAHTTLGMAGQRYPDGSRMSEISEPRLAAFIALSPTLPATGDAQRAFAAITRPLLCITGTHDDDVVGVGATPERRIGVFSQLPTGRKAQLVLADADHMSFAGQTGPAAAALRRHAQARDLQPAHHALVAAITADWWRAQLLGDAAARARLARPAGLAEADVWQQG